MAYGFNFDIGGSAVKQFQSMIGSLGQLQTGAKAAQTAFNGLKLPKQNSDLSKPFVPIKSAIDSASGALGGFENKIKSVKSVGTDTFGSLKSQVVGFGASVLSAQAVFDSLGKTADKGGYENAIKFTGGKEGANNLAFVKQAIVDLKLPMVSAYEGFTMLSGGLMSGKVSMQQGLDLFKSFSEAALVLNIKPDKYTDGLRAFKDMLSKGTIQAEELKGQLGDALPGAFSLVAKAMNMSDSALTKFMEDGKLLPQVVLPKLAAEMHKTFGAGVTTALNSARANFNEFNNTLYTLQTTFGEKIMPTVTAFLQGYLIPAVTWIGNNMNAVLGLAGAIGFAPVMVKTWAFWQQVSNGLLLLQRTYLMFGGGAYGIYATATILARSATEFFSGSMLKLNAIIAANPIGFAITAFALLTAGVVYAWNKFEGFRGFIYGMWEVLKVFGKYIYDFAIAPLVALGEILIGTFTFDTALIQKGMSDALEMVKQNADNMMNAGLKIGQAFNTGWNKGVADFQSTLPKADNKTTTSVGNISGSVAPKGLGIDKKNKDISGENRQVKNITITIGSLISGGFTVVSENIQESEQKIKDIITRVLVDATNQVNYQ